MELNLELYRKYLKETYTIGNLTDVDGVLYPGRHICNTLEDVVRDLSDYNHDGDFDDPGEGKIYGETAIPAGRYEVRMVWWQKHKGYYPMLHDVPGFTGILIHSGTSQKDTLGCILVGENKIKGGLVNSAFWSSDLKIKLGEFLKDKKNKCFITIKQ
jgi:hypothetical protein